MHCRGIRGAITVSANTKEAILAASGELLQKMAEANEVEKEEIACVLFTTTPDLNAEFPAAAAREKGWLQVPLMCGHEMNVASDLPRCLRILILFNTEKNPEQIAHVYLKGTEVLRQETAAREEEKTHGRVPTIES